MNAPLSHTHPNKIKLALQQERLKTTMLENQIKRMETEIKFSGVEVDNELASDISTIMTGNVQNSSPFMKLFWQQQTKLLRNGHKKYLNQILSVFGI